MESGGKITTHVTMLEMLAPPAPYRSRPENGLVFEETPEPDIREYRELYHEVGHRHHWVNRKKLSDGQLAALLHHPENHVTRVWKNGKCIGFTEYHARHYPQMEIVFVGLIASETGKGYGGAVLAHTLEKIWERNPSRVTIETNTLDHPSALYLYQKFGFSPYRKKTVTLKNAS